MWEMQTSYPLPEPIAKITYSIWRFTDSPGTFVGVMRPVILSPPYLWFKLGEVNYPVLRQASLALTELQKILNETIVLAESTNDLPAAARFLSFLDFSVVDKNSQATLHQRRL